MGKQGAAGACLERKLIVYIILEICQNDQPMKVSLWTSTVNDLNMKVKSGKVWTQGKKLSGDLSKLTNVRWEEKPSSDKQ